MNDTDTINMVVAIYGAVVATASFVIAVMLGIIEYRRNQPQVKVRLDTLQLFDTNPRYTNKVLPKFLLITIANRGVRPVTIESFSFLDKSKHIWAIPISVELPVKIEDGESYSIQIPVETLADKQLLQSLRKVRVRDGTGKI
jgi:hypothetical protein